MYLRHGNLTKNQMSIVRQFCQGNEWKIKMKDFEPNHRKVFRILTEGVPSKERESAASKEMRQ